MSLGALPQKHLQSGELLCVCRNLAGGSPPGEVLPAEGATHGVSGTKLVSLQIPL